jgi:hypothetical protein
MKEQPKTFYMDAMPKVLLTLNGMHPNSDGWKAAAELMLHLATWADETGRRADTVSGRLEAANDA